jgi:hypothetical protein
MILGSARPRASVDVVRTALRKRARPNFDLSVDNELRPRDLDFQHIVYGSDQDVFNLLDPFGRLSPERVAACRDEISVALYGRTDIATRQTRWYDIMNADPDARTATILALVAAVAPLCAAIENSGYDADLSDVDALLQVVFERNRDLLTCAEDVVPPELLRQIVDTVVRARALPASRKRRRTVDVPARRLEKTDHQRDEVVVLL